MPVGKQNAQKNTTSAIFENCPNDFDMAVGSLASLSPRYILIRSRGIGYKKKWTDSVLKDPTKLWLTQSCFLCKRFSNHWRKYIVPPKCHLSTGTPPQTSLTLLLLVHWGMHLSHEDEAFSVYVPRMPVTGLLPQRTFRVVEKNSLARSWHRLKVPKGIGLRGNQTKVQQFHLVPCRSPS